ncbi:MAG: hypothetical protein JJE36_03005 [Coriobacteriia bacterium]|nr:hypothetical protein [Coriobacteriia bacterium]
MSDERSALQNLVTTLFLHESAVTRLDVILRAESSDFDEGLQEIVELLPPGVYQRQRLCDQLNSSLKGHGWTRKYGTVD